jgi:restriction system protein
MKNYIRVILGAKSIYAQECIQGGYIGADFDINQDLAAELTENWRDFNAKFRDVWLKKNPEKSKIAAGLACAMLWTICKGIQIGDIIISPDGQGNYHVGEVTSNYHYKLGENLPHRRSISWYPIQIERPAMSQEFKNSTGSVGTTAYISAYADEIERLIGNNKPQTIISTDTTIEDTSTFVLEKYLEEFLVSNWKHTELGKFYDIFEEEGQLVGQQYPSDTGPIDILAISKDKKSILVVELKKGRASDVFVGQIQRYMGYIKGELAESNQIVKGVIIALEDDLRIRRALSVTNNIEFYTYQVSFKLLKS